jgi:hypothetical protein
MTRTGQRWRTWRNWRLINLVAAFAAPTLEPFLSMYLKFDSTLHTAIRCSEHVTAKISVFAIRAARPDGRGFRKDLILDRVLHR